MLQLLLPFQIFFIPGLILLLLWCIYRVVVRKDRAVGFVLYISLVIIVDGFLNTGLYIPGLEKGSIKYSEICAFFLFLGSTEKGLPQDNDRTIIRLAFLYFLLMFFSGMRGYTTIDGIFEFRKIMVPQIISFILAYKGFKSREDYKRFLFFLGALLIIIGLFTFWDVFFDRSLLKSDMLNKPEYWNNRRAGRFGSFFLNPNLMGAFVVLVFPVMFLRTFIEEIKWKRIYCAIGLLALFFALIETQSRGPLLGVVISLIFLFAIPTRRLSMMKKIGYLMLFLAAFYLFMPGFFEHVTERFDKATNSQTNAEVISREIMWSFTQKIIRDYPLAGIGFGEKQYIEYALRYGFREEYSSMPLDNPHNSYLEMAVFAGIPALVLFVLFNIVLIKKGMGVILARKGDEISLYLAGFLAGILGFLASAYVDMHMFTANVAPVYWITCGLAYSIIRSTDRLEKT
jgi:putative inorganic carbon (HCO3(-)) transporter